MVRISMQDLDPRLSEDEIMELNKASELEPVSTKTVL